LFRTPAEAQHVPESGFPQAPKISMADNALTQTQNAGQSIGFRPMCSAKSGPNHIRFGFCGVSPAP
jgi:hypothetical protein